MYKLSDDINHITMCWEITEIIVRENENMFFHVHFVNMDISVNITHTHLSDLKHVFLRYRWREACLKMLI